jgi:hypothetical protein
MWPSRAIQYISLSSAILLFTVPLVFLLSVNRNMFADYFISYSFNSSIADIYVIGTILTLFPTFFPFFLSIPFVSIICFCFAFSIAVAKGVSFEFPPSYTIFLFTWISFFFILPFTASLILIIRRSKGVRSFFSLNWLLRSLIETDRIDPLISSS